GRRILLGLCRAGYGALLHVCRRPGPVFAGVLGQLVYGRRLWRAADHFRPGDCEKVWWLRTWLWEGGRMAKSSALAQERAQKGRDGGRRYVRGRGEESV